MFGKRKFKGYALEASGGESASLLAIFTLYRAYLIHQYDLLNHRTNWFIGINAFLFATYGFTIQKKLEVLGRPELATALPDNISKALDSVNAFLVIICLFGIALSVLAYCLLRAAIKPIHDLRRHFHDVVANKCEASGDQKGVLPYIVGGLSSNTYGPFFTNCIPVLVFVTWLAVLLCTTIPRDWDLWLAVLLCTTIPRDWDLTHFWVQRCFGW